MSDKLKEKMISALTWRTIDRFGQQGVQLIITLILARLLTPDDYGLIGLLSVFIGLSTVLVDGGFGQALIRDKEAKEVDYSTIFYFNIFISILLYIVLFFATPYIAAFFKQPQLTDIGIVLFISVLFNALYVVPYSILIKIFDFKRIAIINIFATIVSGAIGIFSAFHGFGVWALVIQQVLFQLIWAICGFLLVKWRPQFLFSFSVIRKFWSFSIHLLGTTSLNVIFNNLYVLIIGKFYTKSQVGLYSKASKLSDAYSYVFQSILQSSTYSLFSHIQDDKERLIRIYRNIAGKISLVNFPIIAILVATAKPLIFILLSERWLLCVPYFQLLCLAALFTPFYNLNITALNAKGLSKITLRLEIIKKALILVSVFLCFHWGIQAMLVGYVAACTFSYFISTIYLRKELHLLVKEQIKDIFTPFLTGITVFIGSIVFIPFVHNYYLLFSLQVIAGVGIYFILLYFFHREFLHSSWSFVKQQLSRTGFFK